jgi:hypothetical protein
MPVATGQAGSATRSIFARYHRATKASIVCAGVALVSAGFYLWARTAVTVQPLALPSQLVGIPLVRLSDPVIEESGQGAMPAIDSGYPGLVAVATAGPTHIRLELPSIPSPSGLAEVNDASITSPPDLHARVRPREYSVRWPEQIVVEQKRPIGSPVVDVPIQWRYPASGPRGPARPVVDLDIEFARLRSRGGARVVRQGDLRPRDTQLGSVDEDVGSRRVNPGQGVFRTRQYPEQWLVLVFCSLRSRCFAAYGVSRVGLCDVGC